MRVVQGGPCTCPGCEKSYFMLFCLINLIWTLQIHLSFQWNSILRTLIQHYVWNISDFFANIGLEVIEALRSCRINLWLYKNPHRKKAGAKSGEQGGRSGFPILWKHKFADYSLIPVAIVILEDVRPNHSVIQHYRLALSRHNLITQ